MLVPQAEASASGVLHAVGRNGKGDWHRWSSSKLLNVAHLPPRMMRQMRRRRKKPWSFHPVKLTAKLRRFVGRSIHPME